MSSRNERKARDVAAYGARELRPEEALVAYMLRGRRSLRIDLLGGVRKVVQRGRLLAHEKGQGEKESSEKALHRHQKREDTPATNE